MKETSDTFVSVSDCRPLGQRGKQKNNTSTADDVDKKKHTHETPPEKNIQRKKSGPSAEHPQTPQRREHSCIIVDEGEEGGEKIINNRKGGQ